MSGLARIYNPFAYPGIKPGFNQGHVAAAGVVSGHGISAISLGRTLINVLSGKPGVNSGSVAITATVDGSLGPVTVYPIHQTLTGGTDFTGQSTVTDTNVTMAGIVRFNQVNSGLYQVVIVINGAILLSLKGTGELVIYGAGSAETASGLFPSVSVPYFLVASASSSQVNFGFTNLLTGSIQTSTIVTPITGGAATGTYTIGNGDPTGNGQSIIGNIAAAMFSPTYLGHATLKLWLMNPWSFWYPRFGLSVDLEKTSAAAVVFRKTLSQIGGRVGSRQPQGWAS